jgi:hypothetical protein
MEIEKLIDEGYETNEYRNKQRLYIGASGIGNACLATVAFGFRGFPETPPAPKLRRIFRDGNRIESDVVKDLRQAGVHLLENDPMSGKQWEFTAQGGHVIGHADGLIEEDESTILLEIKSMNDARWKKCKKEGVKYSDRHYWAQVQLMMGMAKISKTVFVFYNKNTSEYNSEVVEADEIEYASLMAKAEAIMSGDVEKIAYNNDDWRCRGCFQRESCWEGRTPEPSQRSCANARAEKDGSWSCSKGCHGTCKDWMAWAPKDRQAVV